METTSSTYSRYSPSMLSEQQAAITAPNDAEVSASDSDAERTDESNTGTSNKKRKRGLKISCETCKARKVKCDRGEPACGWCARNNRVCVYQERKKPGGIRIAYSRELEDKVNRLEAVLHSLGRRVEEHISQHDISLPRPDHENQLSQYEPSPHIDGLRTTTSYTNGSHSGVTAETPTQSTPLQNSTWSTTSYDHEPYTRRAETMSVYSVVDVNADHLNHIRPPPRSATSLSPSLAAVMNHQTTHALSTTKSSPESDLPPYDLLYNIVDLYFKHINPWSPILDRKSTVDTLFGGGVQSESDRVLLHAIVATTLRFSRDPRLTPEARTHYNAISRRKIYLYGMENPGIPALQALVILAVDIVGSSNGPQGWNLLALITQIVIQLGLGFEKSTFLGQPSYPSISSLQEFAQAPPESWVEEEGRRRLVWMVYILDRYATIAVTAAFILHDQDMDRRLPCRYDLFSKNKAVETRWPRGNYHTNESHNMSLTTSDRAENLGSFSYHCEVLTILSRVHNFLKQPLDINSQESVQSWRETYQALDGELNTWLQSLPGEYGKISQLCHSDPGSKISNWIMLHAAFVTAVIRLHSSAAYPTVRSNLFTASFNAMQRCLGAVESLREIAQDTLNTSMLDLLGPPFAFALWTSARLLLVHAATTDSSEVDPKIHFFISTLEQMGEYWDVARVYAETLSRVVKENEPSQGAKTFKSMRRAAYELAVQTSYRSATSLQPKAIRVPTQNELEYRDVFDFFNYPLSTTITASRSSSSISPVQMLRSDFTRSSAYSDRNYTDSRSPPGAKTDTRSGNEHSRREVEFRNSPLTPTFAMPSRESDWLNFQPPQE